MTETRNTGEDHVAEPFRTEIFTLTTLTRTTLFPDDPFPPASHETDRSSVKISA